MSPRPTCSHTSRMLFLALTLVALSAAARGGEQSRRLTVIVLDETGLAVASARLTLTHAESRTVIKAETDYAGRHVFSELDAGAYRLEVEKEGFYVATVDELRAGETDRVEIVLNHHREFSEYMDVTYSAPAIDPGKTAATETLGSTDIINLPYPIARDIRSLLPFMPGVVRDASGNVHVNGSSAGQILSQLDGFNISHPVSGLFDVRVSPDALRSIDVLGSRYSAEHGKGSGGVLALATRMGDDRYRFSATNFVPSVQTRKGLALDNWTPRATISGPIFRKRAWFFDAAEAEYGLNIVNDLPEGADRSNSWRLGNLAKAQVNLSQSNILTAAFLINRFHVDHLGLSRFSTLETTQEAARSAYLFTVKNQSYFSKGLLLEIGMSLNQFRTDEVPLGEAQYLITPEGTRGNYFETEETYARRAQFVTNVIAPPVKWFGRHEIRVGADADHIAYELFSDRRPIEILREDGTLSRRIVFDRNIDFRRNNFEVSGFAQDRWSVSNRLLLEFGLRFDWDEITRSRAFSPRFASSYLLTRDGNTKVSAGIGLFHDAASLDFITRPLFGRRLDFFFAEDGQTLARLVETSFEVSERRLSLPRHINWSVGVERNLPGSVHLQVEFIRKRSNNGFTYVDRSGDPGGLLELANERRDRYYALQVDVRKSFKNGYSLFGSYTRSSARTNALFDFSADNPVFHAQEGGPLAWDAPNRFISWGWLPLVKRFDLGYSLEWRDGYPFSVVNRDQQLTEPANSRRFPVYFSLNVHVERRFGLMGSQWALRAGFNNVTGCSNPTGVNNNVDSPEFLTFGGLERRAFTGRIRFLGRK